MSIASGPPMIIPKVPAKNIINALAPKLKTARRSILKVIKISAAGNKYLLATKYKFEVLLEIIPIEFKIAGNI
ncbi:hypothetical protein CAPN006_14950 [Capnocytophaga canimorsus]|nr:hypothetical protein CAPN006_14950 [Capnocytophaga canimorsus]